MGDALTYVSVGLKVVTTRVGRLRKEDIGYWVERESRIKESLPLKRESFFFFFNNIIDVENCRSSKAYVAHSLKINKKLKALIL